MKQFKFKFKIDSIKPSQTEGFNAQLICSPSVEMLNGNVEAIKHIAAAYQIAHPDVKQVPSFMVMSNGKSFVQIKLANIKQLAAAVHISENQTHALQHVSGLVVEATATAYLPKDVVVDNSGQPVVDRLTGEKILANDAHVQLSFDDCYVDADMVDANPYGMRAFDLALAQSTQIEKVWGEKALSKNQQKKFGTNVQANSGAFGQTVIPPVAIPLTPEQIAAKDKAIADATAAYKTAVEGGNADEIQLAEKALETASK